MTKKKIVEENTFQFANGLAHNVHKPSQCGGENCAIHNPSDHHMNEWPMILRETGLIERLCEHGCGHSDPDSWIYFIKRNIDFGVHGCDSCCYVGPPENEPIDPDYYGD